jgi:hypothetical protein
LNTAFLNFSAYLLNTGEASRHVFAAVHMYYLKRRRRVMHRGLKNVLIYSIARGDAATKYSGEGARYTYPAACRVHSLLQTYWDLLVM